MWLRGGLAAASRVRLFWTLVAVVLAAGVGLAVGGWHDLAAAEYLIGLSMCVLVVAVSTWFLLPNRTTIRRSATTAGILVATLVVVAGVGVWLPLHAADATYDGSQVRWAVDDLGGVTHVQTQFGPDLLVADYRGAQLIALSDGHTVADLDANSSTSRFFLAGDRLIARTGLFPDDRISVYGTDGKLIWSAPGLGDPIAASVGTTVFVTCGEANKPCVVSGYNARGESSWRSSVTLTPDFGRLLTNGVRPLKSPSADVRPPTVLPQLALLQSSQASTDTSRWSVIDPDTGHLLTALTAGSVGVSGTLLVTVNRNPTADTCAIGVRATDTPTVVGRTASVDCAEDGSLLSGATLFLPYGDSTRVIPLASVKSQLDPDSIRVPLAGNTPAGDGTELLTSRAALGNNGATGTDGRHVWGHTWAGPKIWDHYSPAPAVTVAGDNSVAILSSAVRLNPLDGARGYDPSRDPATTTLGGHEVGIEVLNLATGEQTGSLRTHGTVNEAYPLGTGSAVINTGGKLVLVGNPVPPD